MLQSGARIAQLLHEGQQAREGPCKRAPAVGWGQQGQGAQIGGRAATMLLRDRFGSGNGSDFWDVSD